VVRVLAAYRQLAERSPSAA